MLTLLALIAWAGTVPLTMADEPFELRAAASDPAIVSMLIALHDRASWPVYRIGKREVAAFIVRRSDGTFDCRLWPAHLETEVEFFRGRIPAGTVAIAHTHPAFTTERPSLGDIETSVRTRLPIIVVTRRSVWAFDPAARAIVPLINDRKWVTAYSNETACRQLEVATAAASR